MENGFGGRVGDLIRADLVTMGGKAAGGRPGLPVMITFAFFTVLGFVVSPLASLYIPFLLSGFLVPAMFSKEIKYNSEKMFCLLPLERKDLVRARFILCIGVFVGADMLLYLLMLISMKAEIFRLTMADGEQTFDVLEMLVGFYGGVFTKKGLFALLYFGVSSFGLVIAAASLRKYFRSSESFAEKALGKFGKAQKKEIAFVCGGAAVVVLGVAEVIPVKPILTLSAGFIAQLAQAADGILLVVLMTANAAFYTAYMYICTLLEYDEREL